MERLTSRTLLLIVVGLGMVLAGCAGNNASNTTPTASTPSADQLTPAGGKALLDAAAAGIPQQFAMSASVLSGANKIITFNATFDNSTKTSYVELRGDPQALAAQSQGNAEAAAFLKSGFSIYTTKEGSLYLANGTAFVFPPANESGQGSSMVPSPEKSPFGQFLSPTDVVGAFQGSNVSVVSAEPTTCHGQAAVRVVFSAKEQGQPTNATADVLNSQPPRLCHLETTLPKESGSGAAADPFSGATTQIDFYYNGELALQVPESVTRAVGLRYTSDKLPFSSGSGDQPSNVTWTFESSGGIPLSEVSVEVKDASGAGSGSADSMSFGAQPTLWSMTLSEGHKTQGGVTLTFTDKDGDGKVSKGDTLLVQTGSGQEPATAVLKDLKTGTYVVPAPGLALVLGLLGLAALALRRR